MQVGAFLKSFFGLQVPLVVTGSAHGGSETLLSAAADTGIAAADDGGTWAGATAVAIPFG